MEGWRFMLRVSLSHGGGRRLGSALRRPVSRPATVIGSGAPNQKQSTRPTDQHPVTKSALLEPIVLSSQPTHRLV